MWNRKVTHKAMWTGLVLFVSIRLFLPAAIHDPNGQTAQLKQSQQQKQMGMHSQMATQAGILCRANDLMGSDVKGIGSDVKGVGSNVKGTRSDSAVSNEQSKNINEQRRADQAFDLNQSAESIGTVKELFIDSSNNEISYVVLESDDKYYAVPWRAFNVQNTSYSTTGQQTVGQRTVGQPTVDQSAVAKRTIGDETTRRDNETQSTVDQRQNWVNEDRTTRSDQSIGQKPILYLNITKEQLQQAPTITSVSAADLSNLELKQTVNTFYSQHITLPLSSRHNQQQILEGARQREMQTDRQGRTTAQGDRQPASSQLTSAKLLKASEVIGLDLQSSLDVDLGSVQDLVIDTREGQIAYALVSYGGFLNLGEKVAVVPWSALTVQMPQRYARIQATEAQLDAAVLEKGNIEKLSEPQFAQNIHGRFNVEPYWGIYGYVPAGEQESDSTKQNWQQNQDQRNTNQDQGKLRP